MKSIMKTAKNAKMEKADINLFPRALMEGAQWGGGIVQFGGLGAQQPVGDSFGADSKWHKNKLNEIPD